MPGLKNGPISLNPACVLSVNWCTNSSLQDSIRTIECLPYGRPISNTHSSFSVCFIKVIMSTPLERLRTMVSVFVRIFRSFPNGLQHSVKPAFTRPLHHRASDIPLLPHLLQFNAIVFRTTAFARTILSLLFRCLPQSLGAILSSHWYVQLTNSSPA